MNESHDPPIERLYRETSREQPGAAGDAAILALAREVAAQAASRNPAVGAHWSRRWHRPLALAASVVLVVGMVSRIGMEPPNGADGAAGRAADSAPASAPVAAAPVVTPATAPSTLPAAAAPSGIAGSVKEAGDVALAKAQSSDMARKPERSDAPAISAVEPQPPAQTAPPTSAPATARAEAPYPGAATTAETGPRPFAVPSRAPMRGPDLASNAAGGAAAAPSVSGEMRRDATPAPAMKPAQRTARENAGAAGQDAAKTAVALPVLSEPQEATLTPENWLTYILDLRRQGQHDAADTSLKRFRLRFPGYPVPPPAVASEALGSGEAK